MLSIYDPRTSWRAKLLHAQGHIDQLTQMCASYRAAPPFWVEEERTDVPNEIAYRFHYKTPIPDGLSLIVGDVLHNLRSALDNFVYGLVEHLLRRALSESEVRSVQMPLHLHPDGFKRFFDRSGRRGLYPAPLIDALATVQPYYYRETARSRLLPEDSAGLSPELVDLLNRQELLWTLHEMSNIDKHRRLGQIALPHPSGATYWASQSGQQQAWRPGVAPFVDGAIVGWITGDIDPEPAMHYEFDIVLEDLLPPDPHRRYEPGATRDIVVQVGAWAGATEQAIAKVGQRVLGPDLQVERYS